jgi:CMP-N-acetylneuraminic acid synthetase
MVECDENQYCKVVKTPDAPIFARQQAPEVFELNGSFYYYRSTFFEEKNDSAITDRSLAYVMPHLCFDIDDQMDFDFLEFLLEKEKLGFSL